MKVNSRFFLIRGVVQFSPYRVDQCSVSPNVGPKWAPSIKKPFGASLPFFLFRTHSHTMSSKDARPRATDTKKVHIADTKMTRQNWYKHVNWLNVVLILGVPISGCIQAFWVPLQLKTAIWAVIYYFFTGLGITAGK